MYLIIRDINLNHLVKVMCAKLPVQKLFLHPNILWGGTYGKPCCSANFSFLALAFINKPCLTLL